MITIQLKCPGDNIFGSEVAALAAECDMWLRERIGIEKIYYDTELGEDLPITWFPRWLFNERHERIGFLICINDEYKKEAMEFRIRYG